MARKYKNKHKKQDRVQTPAQAASSVAKKQAYSAINVYLEKRNELGQFMKGNPIPAAARRRLENNPGNQYNRKMDTPELRQQVFREYCDWIASGRSKNSFVFRNEHVTISYYTIHNYIKQFPLEFSVDQLVEAECRGIQLWEDIGFEMMVGEIQKCQPAIYQMMMRNKFGWDKYENKKDDSLETDVRSLLKKLEEMKMHEVIAIPPPHEGVGEFLSEREVSNVEDFEEVSPSSAV